MARASFNTALQPFRLAEVAARTIPALGRLRSGVAEKRFTPNRPVPRTRFSSTITAHRVMEGRSFDLAEVRAVKSAIAGATINDVVLSVCGGALRRYLLDKWRALRSARVLARPSTARDTYTCFIAASNRSFVSIRRAGFYARGVMR